MRACGWLLVFVLAAPSHTAPAEVQGQRAIGFSARSWRTEHGLPHRQIRDLHQSSDGYIWAATPAGLVRFDGTDFYVLNRTAHPELPDDNFSSLAETADGSLWGGTAAGLARWKNGKLTIHREIAGVRALHSAADGSLLAATTNGVARFDGAKFQRFTTNDGLTGNDIRVAALDSEGTIWAAPEHWMYEGALNKMRRGSGRFSMVGTAGLDQMAHSMALDSQGNFWWGDNLGAHMLSGGERKDFARLDETSSTVVSRLKKARAGVLAVVSPRSEYPGRAGVFLLNANGAERVDVPELSQPTVAIQDFEDAIWVGTREDGLWQLQRKAVTTWRVADGLVDDYVAGVIPLPDGVVALTERGARALRNGMTYDVTPPDYFSGSTPTVMRHIKATGELISVNPRGMVHFFSKGQWRNETLRAGFSATEKPDPSDGSREGFSVYMLREATEGVFVARRDKLVFRMHSGQWITSVIGAPTGITGVRLGDNGVLWIAAAGMLHEFHYTISNNTLILHSQRTIATPNPSTTTILGLEPTPQGEFWMATDRGLCLIVEGQLHAITTRNGLPTDSIYSVLDDQRGGVWMGSNRGLIHAEKADLMRAALKGARAQFVLLREAEGMPTSETMGGFNSVACRTADGRLWFATAKGLVEVDPTREFHNKFRPNVIIETALIDEVPATNGARLEPGRARTVEFRFTSTSLADPRRDRFRYKLDGVDGSWREAESRREAVYTLLGAGEYTFRVIALNNHGLASAHPATFHFTVAPYFWQTVWFRVACGILIALTAFAWHRQRLGIGRRIQALEHDRELQSERARIARDMHDDLGAGLARVALLSDLAAREHEAAPTRQLRSISRQLIRSLDEIVWAIHPGKDNSEELISYLGESAQEFMRDGPVALRLELPQAGDTIHVPSLVRHNLVMALKEALHNVVKHSGARNVTVRLSLTDGDFRMEVADDGQGLRDNGRDGDGLGNMRERLRSVGGELQISSSAEGVRLLAIAPLGRGWPRIS